MLGLIGYFFFHSILKVFFAEKRFNLRKLEGDPFGDSLSGITTVEYVFSGHYSQQVNCGWSEILYFIYEHIVKLLVGVPSQHNLLKDVVDNVHKVIGFVVVFVLLILLENVVDIDLIFESKEGTFALVEVLLWAEALEMGNVGLGGSFDDGVDLSPDDRSVKGGFLLLDNPEVIIRKILPDVICKYPVVYF